MPDITPPKISGKWVEYSPLTATYDTKDGTVVSAEIVDQASCLADVLRIAQIRGEQRERMKEGATS